MDTSFVDFIVNLDQHLGAAVREYREWTYALLFATVLLETGLVLMFVLPGDEVIFVAAALTPRFQVLNMAYLLPLFMLAAFCGDQISYLLGRTVGRRPFENPKGRFLNPRSLHRAEDFYARHGAQAILFGRFIPFVRGVMPFTAALARMPYPRFVAYSFCGALLWTLAYGLSGYYFGKLPFVRDHFGWVLLAVAAVSFLPAGIEMVWARVHAKKKKARKPARPRMAVHAARAPRTVKPARAKASAA
jgi:membrane-associated protein